MRAVKPRKIAHEDGDVPGFAPQGQGLLRLQEALHHLLGDVAAEGVPDIIPFFDVFGQLLAQVVKGVGQVHHFPGALFRHRHREVAPAEFLDALLQRLQRPGDISGKYEPEQQADQGHRRADDQAGDFGHPVHVIGKPGDGLVGLGPHLRRGAGDLLLGRQEILVDVHRRGHDKGEPRHPDQGHEFLPGAVVGVEEGIIAAHVGLAQGLFHQAPHLGELLFPQGETFPFHLAVGVEDGDAVEVHQVGVAGHPFRGHDVLHRHPAQLGITAEGGMIQGFFGGQDGGQFPGDDAGGVLHRKFAVFAQHLLGNFQVGPGNILHALASEGHVLAAQLPADPVSPRQHAQGQKDHQGQIRQNQGGADAHGRSSIKAGKPFCRGSSRKISTP